MSEADLAGPVSYGAVGATQASDLMQYPPAGYRPFEQRRRIGHGEARFNHAAAMVMSWGIQTASGVKVEVVPSPPPLSEPAYTPVVFDDAGNPVVPAESSEDEVLYGPNGLNFVAAGDTAVLKIPVGPLRFRAPCRVIYVIDEPRRKGFAYGTLPGHPERGEAVFIVEQTDDELVWLTIRSFSKPATWYYRLAWPFTRLVQNRYTRRYFGSLSGPIAA